MNSSSNALLIREANTMRCPLEVIGNLPRGSVKDHMAWIAIAEEKVGREVIHVIVSVADDSFSCCGHKARKLRAQMLAACGLAEETA